MINKRYQKSLKPKLTTAIALTLFLMFSLNISQVITAYFNSLIQSVVKPKLEVDILFGSLDESLAVGEWGTDGNPYLIENNQHFINLYVLQNSPDYNLIDENSVFQISNNMGEPNYIGGPSANQLFAMQSIGTEEFPFVSKIRGVRTNDPEKFITLPTGEKSDTSALVNIKVIGKPNQVDIVLFGNAGPTGPDAENLAPNDYIGEISTLLLYNIQITSDTYGAYEPSHKYFVTSGNYETNHVGILVGHAQFIKVDTISVYYSSTNNIAHVQAFDFTPGSSGKYTTAGGIICYYHRVVVDGETEFPVSSDGSSEGVGSGVGGLGLGIVYSQDIWDYMETHTSVGNPATPAPDTPGIGTKPIVINDDGTEHTVYTNFNTVLVAYEFEVPSRYNITYFLEASRGSACFVYLSGERTAANDNNPLHENDISFPPLSSIDYVFKGINDPNRVATVGSPEYISSLTVPYFGLTKNPEFSVHDVPLKDRYIVPISTGFNFTYNISRAYNPDDEKYYIYIWISANVNGSGYTAPISQAQLKTIQQNMNFNFSENSYLDKENYQYVYSDVVSMNINGYNLVNWADIN